MAMLLGNMQKYWEINMFVKFIFVLISTYNNPMICDIGKNEVPHQAELEQFINETDHTECIIVRTVPFEKSKGLDKISLINFTLEKDYEDLAIRLVEKGADYSTKLLDEFSAIETAFAYDRVNFVKWLINNNHIDKNSKKEFAVPLIYQSIGNVGFQNKIFDYLIGLNVDLNYENEMIGDNLAFYAAGLGNLRALKSLISKGVDFRKTDNENLNILMVAVLNNSEINVIKYLIDLGVPACNPIPTMDNRTLLEIVVSEEYQTDIDIVCLLKETCK